MIAAQVTRQLDKQLGRIHANRYTRSTDASRPYFCDRLASSEQDLWYAVLRQAILDLEVPEGFYRTKAGRGCTTSEEFFNSDHYSDVCHTIGINPERLQSFLGKVGLLPGEIDQNVIEHLRNCEAEDLEITKAA